MVGSGPDVFAVWAYVIANAVDGQVELNPILLSASIGCPPDRIVAAIEALCSPDKNSRSQAEDGRRLIKEGSFAYKVVNHSIYRSILNESERREYNRVKQAERRARLVSVKKSNTVSMTVIDKSAVSAHTEAEAEAENKVPPTPLSGGGNSKTSDPRIEELQEAVAKSAGRKPPLHAATLKRFKAFLKDYSVDDYVVTAEWCAVQNKSASEPKYKKPVGVLLLDDLNKFEGRLSEARAWQRNRPRKQTALDTAMRELRPEVNDFDTATHRPMKTAAELCGPLRQQLGIPELDNQSHGN